VALTKRVELLFDPGAYKRLEELAESKTQSVASLIRSAVERMYLQPTLEQKKAALKRLVSANTDFGEWEEVKASMERERVREIEAS